MVNGHIRAALVQKIRSLCLAVLDTVNNLLLWENLGSNGTVKMDAGHFSETSEVFYKDRT